MNFLHVCLIIGILGVAQVKSDVLEDLDKISKACREESKVSEDDMNKFIMGGMKDEDAKDNMKCEMKCVMEKQGYFKNGVLNVEASKKFLESLPTMHDQHDLIKDSLDKCKNEKGADDCDTAYKITKCVTQHTAKM